MSDNNNDITQAQAQVEIKPQVGAQPPVQNIKTEVQFTLAQAPGSTQPIVIASTLQFPNLEGLDPELTQAALYVEDATQKLKDIDPEIVQLIFDLITKIISAIQGEWEYTDFISPKYKLLNYPRIVKGLPASEIFSVQKIGQTIERIIEFVTTALNKELRRLTGNERSIINPPFNVHAQLPFALARSHGILTSEYEQPTFEIVRYLFNNWKEDVEFCQQTLTGVNPLHIRLVQTEDELNQIPDVLLSLNADGKSVKELFSAKSLFILDYKDLAEYQVRPDIKPTRYFSAPTALLYKNKDNQLGVVGITLNDGTKAVYTPTNKAQQNKYLLAKMYVAVADQHIHEFQYHLGFAHLLMEPFVVATHRCFSKKHPLRLLLTPHFEETIFINFLARVFPEFTELLAAGTKQGLELASKLFDKWSFTEWNFENQLKSRGFSLEKDNGISDYFYRDDGALLWKAFGDYAKAVVDKLYSSNDDLNKDGELQAWLGEITSPDKANVKSFPKITTKEGLVSALQTLIWNGSALHSAINYPQFTYDGFFANRPNAIYFPMPEGDGDITEKQLFSALPSIEESTRPTLTFWLLSLPSHHHLMNLSAFDLNSGYGQISTDFRKAMEEITETIKERNVERAQRNKAYKFLLPENVACSVNI